jgi:hypothetical protein
VIVFDDGKKSIRFELDTAGEEAGLILPDVIAERELRR